MLYPRPWLQGQLLLFPRSRSGYRFEYNQDFGSPTRPPPLNRGTQSNRPNDFISCALFLLPPGRNPLPPRFLPPPATSRATPRRVLFRLRTLTSIQPQTNARHQLGGATTDAAGSYAGLAHKSRATLQSPWTSAHSGQWLQESLYVEHAPLIGHLIAH